MQEQVNPVLPAGFVGEGHPELREVNLGLLTGWCLETLLKNLIQAERAGRLQARMRTHVHPSLLIIDEIGFLPISPGGASLFFQLVNARYEKGAMILTSNLGFADWGEMFGDPVMATALLDRLLHHSVVITITGHSYRLREHMELIPDHVRTNKSLVPPPAPGKRGRPKKVKGGGDQ